jgi:hypothetical protein
MKSNTTWRVNDETRRRDFLGFVAHAPLDASNLIVVFFFVVEKGESRRVLSCLSFWRIFRIFEERRSAHIRIAGGCFRGTNADDDETVRK